MGTTALIAVRFIRQRARDTRDGERMSQQHDSQKHQPGTSRRTRVGRRVERGIAIYGAIVFTLLWAGIVLGVASGGAIFDDAWSWLTSLQPIASVLAWLLFLPIAIGLWAWSAGLAGWATALVLAGLIAWTGVAINGLVRTFRRRTQQVAR
jgi:hypothetical protein